jgi:hypothetical protein
MEVRILASSKRMLDYRRRRLSPIRSAPESLQVVGNLGSAAVRRTTEQHAQTGFLELATSAET